MVVCFYLILIELSVSNSVDPEQMSQIAASDLGLHCFHISDIINARLAYTGK